MKHLKQLAKEYDTGSVSMAMMVATNKIEKSISVESAISLESLSFSQLSRNIDLSDLAIAMTKYILYSCQSAWSIPNALSPNHAFTFSSQLTERLDFTLEDVVCLMKYATRGEFGPVYNRIDVGVLNEWLQKYLEIRIPAFEEMKSKEKSQFIIGNPERTNKTLGLAKLVRK